MTILGIETSCDETALSVINVQRAFDSTIDIQVLADKILSQVPLHMQFGGVFPNLAKREHQKNLPLLLQQTIKDAGMSSEKPALDAIAVTIGPGLEPCLWTGILFAKKLAAQWNIPIVPVNHMEGHIFSALLRRKNATNYSASWRIENINFPALALLISGGHTELVLMQNYFKYKIIGATRDDAVGEAFDKVARLLGLPYPGGPEISCLAETARQEARSCFSVKSSFSQEIILPRPMIHSSDFDFSFSGLKTAVLFLIKKLPALTENLKKEIAKEFEDAVTEVLVSKTKKAIELFDAKALLIGGGVIANIHIRRAFNDLANTYDRKYLLKKDGGGNFLHIPEPNLTTDNALMIAVAGYTRLMSKNFSVKLLTEEIVAKGNLRLDDK